MEEPGVIIAGGGPSGLMLAAELALAGVGAVLVERRLNQDVAGSRAGGLHSRTLEIFDQRGIVDRFLAEGQKAQIAYFAGTRLDISDFPTRHPYGLGLWQNHIERILAGWVDELEVPIRRGVEVTGFGQDDSGVDLELSDGSLLRARYLVGCDGGRSLVRKTAGIAFPGSDPTISNLIAVAELAETPPEWGTRRDTFGTHALGRVDYEIHDGQIVYADHGPVGILVTEQHIGQTAEPTLGDLRAALIAVYGTDYGVHSPTSISRFTDAARQAASYRKGRVLIAGDAAHVHPPDGGQGLQTGVQDAVNLGWKLAQVVKGVSPDSLLDTYHAERHPIGTRVLRNTMASIVLRRENEQNKALRATIAEMLAVDEPRRRFAAMMSGLDIHYDLGAGHPLLGRRMPDLDLATVHGPLRVFSLLHKAKPVLLNLGQSGAFDISSWADRVQLVDAKYVGPWELPALGPVAAPPAVLIRPDGYVAWAGERAEPGLADALNAWCGPSVISDSDRQALSLEAKMPIEQPALTLHMHPLASYCWKVLVALYEAGTPFRITQIDGVPKDNKAYAELWPIAKMPLLQDGDLVLPETSIIIDYLQAHHPGSALLIPSDGDAAREVRLWDRFFDLYVQTPMQKLVADRMRPESAKDPCGVNEARAILDTAYAMLERRMAERTWAAAETFSMAECAAMPALFYVQAVYPYFATHPALAAYFERLVSRPSVQRVIREAQPWLQYFPFVDAIEPRFRAT